MSEARAKPPRIAEAAEEAQSPPPVTLSGFTCCEAVMLDPPLMAAEAAEAAEAAAVVAVTAAEEAAETEAAAAAEATEAAAAATDKSQPSALSGEVTTCPPSSSSSGGVWGIRPATGWALRTLTSCVGAGGSAGKGASPASVVVAVGSAAPPPLLGVMPLLSEGPEAVACNEGPAVGGPTVEGPTEAGDEGPAVAMMS